MTPELASRIPERPSVMSAPSIQRLKHIALGLLGVVAIALSARVAVAIPGSDVPQSAQTLAVLLVGALLGAPGGALTLTVYVVAGVAGLPVFADGASGWTHAAGASAGYLIGFIAAAAGVGWLADRGPLRRFVPALAAMVGGHALILALGWVRLAWMLGPAPAFRQGVEPFMVGGVVKSVVAALVVVLIGKIAHAETRPA